MLQFNINSLISIIAVSVIPVFVFVFGVLCVFGDVVDDILLVVIGVDDVDVVAVPPPHSIITKYNKL